MDIPREILEARISFEQAEKEISPERKAKELKEGIDLLNSYLEEKPNAPKEIGTFITNLRRSHTRRLLVQIQGLRMSEFKTWLRYIGLLISGLKEELEYVTKQDPALKAKFDEFWSLWSDDLLLALKEFEM